MATFMASSCMDNTTDKGRRFLTYQWGRRFQFDENTVGFMRVQPH